MDKKLETLLRCWNLDNIEYSNDLLDIDSNRQVVADDVKKVIDSISNSDADSYFDLPEEIWEEFEIQPDDIVKALDQIDENSNILVTGDKDLQDGIIVDGCICEDNCKRWFEIYSIEYIGANYAALIGG